jgi:hypothetical protein
MATIKEDGVERRVTAAYLTKRGLDGDGAASRLAMAAIEKARAARGANAFSDIRAIVRVLVTPGSVNSALVPLRMARKLDGDRPSARMVLERWIVDKALARLRTSRLSLEEQAIILAAVGTRTRSDGPIGGRSAIGPAFSPSRLLKNHRLCGIRRAPRDLGMLIAFAAAVALKLLIGP